jgi:hypothetical protein
MAKFNGSKRGQKPQQSGGGQVDQQYKQYSIKKGIGFGAFGGFIAAIAFTGIMFWMPSIFGFPTGTFLYILGTSIGRMRSDPVLNGLAAFSVVLIEGIIVGIIFGIISSKVKILHPSNKKKGTVLGIATGIIAFLVLYLPFALTLFPQLLPNTLASFPQSELSTMGNQPNIMLSLPYSSYLPGILGLAIFAYIVYGFFMGGIVTLAYSIYHFDLANMHKVEMQQKER